MKKHFNLIVGIGLTMLMACSLPIQAQKVSFSQRQVSLQKAFEQIEKVSKYKIEYNSTLIDVSRKVTLNQKGTEVLKVVADILKEAGYSYTLKGRYIIVSAATQKPVEAPRSSADKQHKVSGNVKDMSGEPVIGATVMVKGSITGTVTDLDGNFTIDAAPEAQLVVSYIGFDDQTITPGSRSTLHIVMKENIQSLDELVVTAYGTQTRRNVTGSMQTIDFGDLKDIVGGQFTQKMQGQVAGVQVTQNSGTPGSGMSVKIRGAASLSTGANPLYVVDGFPIVGDINNINPSEIESMSILKDAAATALYGSRAAFGVVLITTKTPRRAKPW